MKTPRHSKTGERASVLISTMAIITILAFIASSALYYSTTRCLTMGQTSDWHEAFLLAENGLNTGIENLNNQLSGTNGLTVTSGTNETNYSGTYQVGFSHGGDGVTSGTANFSVTGTMVNGHYCYKVRSIGIARIPGRRTLSMDGADNVLRKLNLGGINGAAAYTTGSSTGSASGTTGVVVTTSQGVKLVDAAGNLRTSSRTLEAWVCPITTADAGIAVVSNLDLNNKNLVLDAINSSMIGTRATGTTIAMGTTTTTVGNGKSAVVTTSTTYMTIGVPGTTGQYTNLLSPPIYDANIASNSTIVGAVNANSATIYGEVLTNGAQPIGANNALGGVRTDYSQTFDYYDVPLWSGSATTTNLGTINSTTTLTGGTKDSPVRYKATAISLNGGKNLYFNFPTTTTNPNGNTTVTGPDTTKGYIEIYVVGDITTKGSGNDGSIIIQPGVNVKMYVGGNVDLGGNSFTNSSQMATNFSLYEVGPGNPSAGTPTYTLGGNAGFYGMVYAPGATMTLGGNGYFVGSIVAYSALLSGNTTFIRDSALATSAKVLGYSTVSWFEDTGPKRNSL